MSSNMLSFRSVIIFAALSFVTLETSAASFNSKKSLNVKLAIWEDNQKPFSWLGRIRFTRSLDGVWYPCSGVAITKRHVLAPAHCVKFMEKGDTYSFLVGNKRHAVSRIFIHPKYHLENSSYDVAVLRLNSILTSYLALSGNIHTHSVIGRRLDVVSIVADKHPKNVHTLAKVTGHKYCQRIFEDFQLTQNEVCAFNNQDRDILNGAALLGIKVESGSETFQLIGISTHGPYERNPKIPDLFTLISPYKKWINNIISL